MQAALLDHLDELDLEPALVAELRARFEGPWQALGAELRAAGPDALSNTHLLRFASLTTEIAEVLGPHLLVALREMGDLVTRDMVAAELQRSDVMFKLALRQLDQALASFFEVVEVFSQLTLELSPQEFALLINRARADLGEATTLEPEAERLVRAELCITMALECLKTEADASVLAGWTRSALMATRTLKAALQLDGWATLRADLARLVAEQAHADWTPEDIEDEFGPWPFDAS
jgi:hypothetical protein